MSPRFKAIDDNLCISVEATATALGSNTAYSVVKNALSRARKGFSYWQHYSDDTDQRRKWIIVATLPESTRLRVETVYGQDLWQAYYTERLLEDALSKVAPEDRTFFLNITAGAGTLPADRVAALCEAAGWLRLGDDEEYWPGKWPRRTAFWCSIVVVLKERSLKGFKITNSRSFERRLNRFKDEGLTSLLPGHLGNCNAKKLGDTQVKRIVHLYANPLKPTIEDVTNIFNREATERGWQTVTYERVRQILHEPGHKSIITLARHGKDAAKNLLERTIKRRRPSFPDALWIGDGSSIQLYYQDDKGQIRSDLYAYVVSDGASDCILGYSISHTETGTLVQAAFRDAVRKTMMMPHQIQYDNSGANKGTEAQQLFTKLSSLHFPTMPYNGKSKVLEAVWGRLEQRNLHHFANFKGGNITAKSLDARANPDFLARQFKSGEIPSLSGVVAQFRLAVETVNNTPSKKDGQTPAERYRKQNDQRRAMDYLLFVEAFWVERRNKARYTKDGLTIEIDGQRYTYEVEASTGIEDMNFRRKHLGDQFSVRYDPDDLEYINLYNGDSWIATAHRKFEAAMARVDLVEGEGQIISNSLTQRKEYWKDLQNELQALDEEMSVVGFEPLNHRTLHKEAYNRLEGAMLDELIEATAIGVEPMKQKRTKIFTLYDDREADGRVIE